MKHITALAVIATLGLLASGCSTQPSIGSEHAGTVATGSAGGANSNNANSKLEHCSETLGTVSVVEEQDAPWFYELRRQQLSSTIPVLRMLIQQSNCFVVVERGQAMRNMQQERNLAESGEIRAGSNMGKGQVVAADYTLSPSVTFSQKGTGGIGGGLGGPIGGVLGAVVGSVRFNDASTMLVMIDNRSGVQLAAAEGSSRNMDFSGGVGAIFPGAVGGLGGYSNTPQGKVVLAAFFDAYNQLVQAVRNYQAQTVKGGLGTGGRLGVQGGTTPASQEVGQGNKRK